MEELLKEYKVKIERDLYTQVMLLIENEYNIEGIPYVYKKDSRKIIFKNKKAAIQNVAEAIERFSTENGLDKNKVKDCLLQIIENRVNLNSIFIEECENAKEIILTDFSEEER